MDDIVAAVRESLAEDTDDEFERRVERQASDLETDCRSGLLDTGEFAVGLELEAYVVDDEDRLRPVPDEVFEAADCGKELGVHNVEINTEPDVFHAAGLDRQVADLRERVDRTRRALRDVGLRLVLDAMWTVPPAEGSAAYLGTVREQDGVVVAENMRSDPRYHALDNEILRRAGGEIRLDLPGVDRALPTILVESLAASMQPHLQVPRTEAFPRYFNVAVRAAGPLLALSANSPFLPADLYDASVDPESLVAETPHELRVPVFEQSINAGVDPSAAKVRFPRDLESPADVVDRLVADETYAPFLTDPGRDDPDEGRGDAFGGTGPDRAGRYPDRYPELDHKRGTYWRWVRAVVGGSVPRGTASTPADAEASIRLEFRPLPTQPTATDTAAVLALTVGLLRGLVVTDHPVVDLPWSDARESFYSAVADGPGADLRWVTADGDRTTDRGVVFDEVLEYARRGLADAGLGDGRIDEYLDPVEVRREAGTTPSAWKKARVSDRLDEGATLAEAITGMQREYNRRAERDEPFAEWL